MRVFVSPLVYVLISQVCALSTFAFGKSAVHDRLLQTELISCDIGDPVGVITDRNGFEFALLQWTRQRESPATYFDVQASSNPIQSWIRATYTNNRATYFVVAVNNPGNVLESVDTIFRNESYRKLAALPHKSRWLITVWTNRQLNQIKDQQLGSLLDNVAVVSLQAGTKQPAQASTIRQIWTSVWANDGTKRLTRVNTGDLGKGCALFPNTNSGLNGRKLKLIAMSPIAANLRRQIDRVTGKTKNAGMLIEFLRDISQMMNFTYDIELKRWTAQSFDDVKRLVSNGTFDMVLIDANIFWGHNSQMIDLSGPHSYDTITGIYKISHLSCDFWFLPNCENNSIYIFLALMYTVTLAVITTFYFLIIYGVRCKGMIGHETGNCMLCCRKEPDGHRLENTPGYFINQYLHSLSYFVCTSFNQGTTPSVRAIPARILVGVWGIFTLCLSAWLTSNMTADAVRNTHALPFNTFIELTKRSDYTWGILNSADTVNHTLTTSTAGFMKKFNQRANRISYNDTLSTEENVDAFLQSLPRKFVFVCYKALLQDWLKQQPNPNDYVIMDDALFQTNYGCLFPKHSELNPLMSLKINDLYDTGVLEDCAEKSQLNKSDVVRQVNVLEGKNSLFFFWMAAFVSLLFLCIAVLVLIGEILRNKI